MAGARPREGEGYVRPEDESLEDGEVDLSLTNIERVWKKATELHTPGRMDRRSLMDSLGLITPGVFKIGGREKQEEWMAEEIERKRRRDREDEQYQGKL